MYAVKRHRLIFALACLALLTGRPAAAQFYLGGEDPGGLRWSSVETSTYRIIYPDGLDSLAREYARSLEQYRRAVGRSAGVMPGEWQWGRKTAVVLHTHTATSNATVVWAPKRLEIYTNPQAYETDPLPWIDNLTLHEQRHLSQMQMGYRGPHRILSYIVGEMWPGACAGIYVSNDWLEGDAVITETALSRSGRGRTADFLNYYMMSFDQGVWRDYYHWKAGSERYDFPDHYALGYLFYGGLRAFYDAPLVSAQKIADVGRRPLGLISNHLCLVRDISGKRPGPTFQDIARKTYALWARQAELRAPYSPSDTLTRPGWYDTDYHHPLILEDGIYITKHDKARTSRLVRIDRDGREHFVGFSAGGTSCLHPSHDGRRIWWSETVADARWTLASYSIIRYRDIIRSPSAGKDSTAGLHLGPARDLTRETRYYNPCPSHDGRQLAVTEHLVDGRTAASVLSTEDGRLLYRALAPDGLQFVDVTWLDDELYASGVSQEGFGIYRLDGLSLLPEQASSWTCLLEPQPVKIHHLDGDEGMLCFSSDRNGSDEWYRFDPSSRKLWQMTSLRYGGEGFEESPYDGRLYYSLNTLRGQMLASTPMDSLQPREVSFADCYRYPVADKLSGQEAALAAADTLTGKTGTNDDKTVRISAPKRYSKLAHLFRFHSWTPFYANVDNIMEMSYDRYYDLVGLGLSAFSQNELGTAVFQGGYCAHKDPYDKNFWRHSGHFKFTYSGWYPVFELRLDINDRAAQGLQMEAYTQDEVTAVIQAAGNPLSAPYVRGSLSVYLPLRHTRSGWTYGFLPRLSYSVSNDRISPDLPVYKITTDGEGKITDTSLKGVINNYFTPLSPSANQVFSAYLRGYAVMNTAESAYYPRWGVGAEVAGMMPLWFPHCNPAAYAYLYSYLPGFFPSNGWRLTAKYQHLFHSDKVLFHNSFSSTLPRGFANATGLVDLYPRLAQQSVRVSADYAMPFYIGDPGWGSFINIRRMVVIPHFDYSRLCGNNGTWKAAGGELWSAGASLSFEFSSFLWMWIRPTLGVSFSYNGGGLAETLRNSGMDVPKFYVAPVVSFSF